MPWDRFSIPRDQDRPTRVGPVPFGFDYLNHQLVKNEEEQAAIRMMQKSRAGGLVPTKQNVVWQVNTVRGILVQA
jgi:hypothetical protein